MPHSVTSQNLESTTELTMIMPVKTGFIEAMEPMTYATRLRRLMMALNGVRKTSREKSLIRTISDSVERIETILSFRLSLLNNDSQLLLAVTFDGAWEPYIRKIWYDMGPLLDIIACNCEGYTLSVDCSFKEYAAWIRRYQVNAQFFYAAADLTPADFQYLREAERLQRETHDPNQRDQQIAGLYVEEPEVRAAQTARARPDVLIQQGLMALGVLDSLRDIYPDGTRDGDILLRAAHELLLEFQQANTKRLIPAPIRQQFEPQLLWFEQPPLPRNKPAIEAPALDYDDIQGGIINPYDAIKTGALLLFRITDAAKARKFLASLPVSSEGAKAKNGIYYNLAITLNGLRRLGVDDSDIQRFPAEFLQGMEARAGELGDERDNHPGNWTPPQQNWNNSDDSQSVVLSSVDFVVQLRSPKTAKSKPHAIVGNRQHPLFNTIDTLAKRDGVQLLSVEAMASYDRGHFGFVDGISQPVISSRKKPRYWSDVVAPGELLLGHQNDRDLLTPEQAKVPPLFNNGTFMVVRKIQQNVAALDTFVNDQQSVLSEHGMNGDDLKALMLGRKANGKPLLSHKGENDFNFVEDPEGARCPLQSHIRRSNPRHPALGKPERKLPVPRIVRRGMSYGPQDRQSDDKRGLMFIAYNASIANQFEVLQGWLSGANASNTYSGLADPFLAAPRLGEKRTFRCLSPKGEVLRFDIDKSENEKRSLTELLWGMYLFVPSLSALKLITSPRPLQAQSDIATGEAWIAKLQQLEQYRGAEAALQGWCTALEDASAAAAGVTSAIWSAIRENHGALRTPYGILVGREDLVDDILKDDKTFSVCGYAQRMQASLGPIYLGKDSGDDYYRASDFTNATIMKVTEQQGFELARMFTQQQLQKLDMLSGGKGHYTISLRWLADQVLADLCKHWFDIPDGDFILAGGKPAPKKKTLHCPFHFTPPSRYIFSPNPGEFAAGLGEDAGRRLREAAIGFVKANRGKKSAINGPISKPLFDAIDDDIELAQNLIGAMMGFLPTAMGLFLKTFYLWMSDASLPRLQQDFHRAVNKVTYASSAKVVLPPMMIAMQKAPVPFMIWRTTTRPSTLAGIDLHRTIDGQPVPDRMVISISSVTQGKLKKGELDVCPIFGGDRTQAEHPTHACPGKPLAMGVLLGMTTALLEGATLEDGGMPLVLRT